MFKSLSSTSKTLIFLNKDTSISLFFVSTSFLLKSISKGNVISNVVPSFFLEETLIVPPIISTIRLTIDRPKPEPPYSLLFPSFSWLNGVKVLN